VIAGTTKLRESFEQGMALGEIEKSWKEDEDSFRSLREKYFLY
jgi:uncharacterized protein YbbC (DUF1343 family)